MALSSSIHHRLGSSCGISALFSDIQIRQKFSFSSDKLRYIIEVERREKFHSGQRKGNNVEQRESTQCVANCECIPDAAMNIQGYWTFCGVIRLISTNFSSIFHTISFDQTVVITHSFVYMPKKVWRAKKSLQNSSQSNGLCVHLALLIRNEVAMTECERETFLVMLR